MHNSKFRRLLVVIGLLLPEAESKVVDVQTSEHCLRVLAACTSRQSVTCSLKCAPIPTATEQASNSPVSTEDTGESISPTIASVKTSEADLHDPTLATIGPEGSPASLQINRVAEGETYDYRRLTEQSTDPATLVSADDQRSSAVAEIATTCSQVCVDDRIQNCIGSNICQEPIRITEQWNVTHYCLANNGDRGGWGFRLPLAVSLLPSSIESVKFQSEIFPATEPTHISSSPALDLVFALTRDSSERSEDMILRKCDIEKIPGDNIVANLKSSGKSDNSKILSFTLGPQDLAANIASHTSPIEGDQLVVTIIGSVHEIANGGLVPPPFDDTVVEISHTINPLK